MGAIVFIGHFGVSFLGIGVKADALFEFFVEVEDGLKKSASMTDTMNIDGGIEAKHRLLRSGYSLASCSPAEFASASPDVGFYHVGFGRSTDLQTRTRS